MVFMISEMLAPPFRWSISITWAVLLPPRMPAGFGAGAAFLPWGAFLAAGAFLADLLFTGAPLADCAPAFGLRVAFGFAGATSGLAASPKLWMRAQMRLAAPKRVEKCRTRRHGFSRSLGRANGSDISATRKGRGP